MFVFGKYCQPILMFVDKARSLLLSGASERNFIHLGSSLTSKNYTRLERIARDKHFSILQKSVEYGQKQSYNIGPNAFTEAKAKLIHCKTQLKYALQNRPCK